MSVALLNARKTVQKRISTLRNNQQDTFGEIEDRDEENIFEILGIV